LAQNRPCLSNYLFKVYRTLQAWLHHPSAAQIQVVLSLIWHRGFSHPPDRSGLVALALSYRPKCTQMMPAAASTTRPIATSVM
jgi:hypothetical protein